MENGFVLENSEAYEPNEVIQCLIYTSLLWGATPQMTVGNECNNMTL